MSNLSGLKRNTIDKFYTKTDVVKQIGIFIKNNLDINKEDLIIEPSAGNGSFINVIKNLSNNYIFLDIHPENHEIIKQDYLTFDFNSNNHNKNIHIIGNPPFGRQSSLAIKFIKKSCEFCSSLSFILPKSFKKDSKKKHIPLNYHLIYEYDLPENSFILNKQDYDVPCVFQIWKKMEYNREELKKLKPTNFKFVKKNENPDIAFRRVGVYAGKIHTDIENKSQESHYFIKFNDFNQNIIEKISKINFSSSSNTVGAKSISKQELIKEFNMII